ncbi:MAG: OB-fold domain-containing protein [Acidobacteria bacterium]|nr:OB-fold domain-containing protein [Acidobacteriota bacterium]
MTLPAPEIDDLTRPYWEGLAAGQLTFQRCRSCGHAWLPARHECPNCLGSEWGREPAQGGATLVSWVVYHIAYHPAFKNRLPYTVGVVQLDEGPRLISNVIGDPSALRIEQRLRLVIEREGETAVPRFAPA